jgi:pyruvate carboxylase
MGNKVEARKMAEAAGVPCIPGTPSPVTTWEAARDFCQMSGFPVMLKAAYGGGGRGMRQVYSMDELEASFDR